MTRLGPSRFSAVCCLALGAAHPKCIRDPLVGCQTLDQPFDLWTNEVLRGLETSHEDGRLKDIVLLLGEPDIDLRSWHS